LPLADPHTIPLQAAHTPSSPPSQLLLVCVIVMHTVFAPYQMVRILVLLYIVYSFQMFSIHPEEVVEDITPARIVTSSACLSLSGRYGGPTHRSSSCVGLEHRVAMNVFFLAASLRPPSQVKVPTIHHLPTSKARRSRRRSCVYHSWVSRPKNSFWITILCRAWGTSAEKFSQCDFLDSVARSIPSDGLVVP